MKKRKIKSDVRKKTLKFDDEMPFKNFCAKGGSNISIWWRNGGPVAVFFREKEWKREE